MGSRLVNVRLDEGRLRKARELRKNGIAVSDVLRDAIDRRFQALRAHRTRDARATMTEIFEQHPDPPDLPPRTYSVHDRAQARRAVQRQLRHRR